MMGELQFRWKQLERELCHLLDGKRTPASGASYRKGDVESDIFLAEAKYRSGRDERGCYIPFEIEWLETIWNHAQRVKKIPLLALEWEDGCRAALIPSTDYNELGGTADYLEDCIAPTRTLSLYYDFVPCLLIPSKIEVPALSWAMIYWCETREIRQSRQEILSPRKKKKRC